MMDQYKQETLQIHAPTDLIRRTKEAVREEERRIQREQVQNQTPQRQTVQNQTTQSRTMQNQTTQSQISQGQILQNQSAVKSTRNFSRKAYRWALPIAAAAVCLLILDMAVMRLGKNLDKSYSGASMEMVAEDSEENDMELAAEGAEANGMGMTKGEAAAGAGNYTAGVTESAASIDGYDSGIGMTQEGTADMASAVGGSYDEAWYDAEDDRNAGQAAENKVYEDAGNRDNVAELEEKGMSGSASMDGLSIREVKDRPDFVSDPDTECITAHGLKFYVTVRPDNTWAAYVRMDGIRYVVERGDMAELSDREAFAEEAYDLLEKYKDGE